MPAPQNRFRFVPQFRLTTLLAFVAGLSVGFAPLKLWEVWQSPSPAVFANLELMEIDDEAIDSLFGKGTPRSAYHQVDARLQQRLDAAKQLGTIHVFSSPTIMTLSRQPANIQVGGAFPVPTVSAQGIEAVEMKEYGTKVMVLPILQRNGLIRLEYDIELSHTAGAKSVTMRGINVPDLLREQYSGQIEAPDGASVLFPTIATPEETDASQSRQVWIKLTASTSSK